MKALGFALFVLLILGAGVSCEAYKFNDCKTVGHSTFYCVMRIGS